MFNHHNVNIYGGRVGRYIRMFEAKTGNTALRFAIYVGTPDKYGFWQECVIYGANADRIANEIKPGDYITIYGKKRFMSFTTKTGRVKRDDCCVGNSVFIIKKSLLGEEFIED